MDDDPELLGVCSAGSAARERRRNLWGDPDPGFGVLPFEDVREVLGIPRRVSVVCLLCIGHLQGSDKKYAGRVPPSRVVFSERYGQPLEIDR